MKEKIITDQLELVKIIIAEYKEKKKKGGVWRISVIMENDPAKSQKQKGRIVKITTGNLDLNANFASRLEKNGLEPFKGEDRKWGVRIGNSPIVEHKGKYYVTAAPVTHKTSGAVGVVLKTNYTLSDGITKADDDTIREVCGPKKEYVQGQDYRDYCLDNVKKMTIRVNDTKYIYQRNE